MYNTYAYLYTHNFYMYSWLALGHWKHDICATQWRKPIITTCSIFNWCVTTPSYLSWA